MDILLDGNTLLNKDLLFKSLKNQINSEDFIGNNLDSLWDVLTSSKEDIILTIVHSKQLENNLGEYYTKLISLFNELKDTETKVTITIK